GRSIAIAYDNGSLRTATLDESMHAQQVNLTRSFWDRLRKYELSIHQLHEFSQDKELKFLVVKKIRSNNPTKNGLYKSYRAAVGSWDLKSQELKLGKWDKIKAQDKSLVSKAPCHIHGFEKVSIQNKMIYIDGDSLYTDHSDLVTAVAKNPVFDQFATASWDGSVKIWNRPDNSLALNYSSMGESDYIMTDPSSYYYATKGALRGIGFFVKGEVLAFDQFDIKYNRPDLVFAQLPYISSSTIQNLELAYKKRLSKLNLNLNELSYNNEIPELHIDKKSIDYVVHERNYSIAIEGLSENSPLKALHVLVNGVPIYGANGHAIDNQKTYYKKVELKLTPGRNKIEAYATNANGVSSYREIIDVNCQVRSVLPDLYLVTIGASKYKMSDYNLTFAAKDAHDIAAAFKQSKYFKNVHTLELIDEKVRNESLSKIQAFIGKAKEADVVIISVAGHGVLSEDFDYYLATYDMDFNNPEDGGIAYEDLEEVLETTASRQKTLLLDACQ
ncbi:MAG: WD40 domain-containing protein, partial [Bacteroidetes bacterium]|nr:WD40 domain-containing protein [Bacteroidota bacterium]